MPVMDGYELLRRLKAINEVPPCVFLALTGYGRHSDRERCLATGFAEHFVKPVDPAALHLAMSRTGAQGGTPSHDGPQAGR
ncbi:hypothetical protein BVI1335_1600022 [Burkholderia vietnamiensis]|nr:hypothetical protein BVI1335_1600022 [Burkholderia vietnamiensis]